MTPILLGIFFFLHINPVQGSELRYSRQIPSEILRTSTLGLTLHITTPNPDIDPTAILSLLNTRMGELEYTVLSPPDHNSQNLILHIICEGPLTPVSTSSNSENVLVPDQKTTPPCHMTYEYLGESIPWRNIDRIVFGEGIAAVQQIPTNQTLDPNECILLFLQYYDFPVLIAAEWGHVDRLIQVLNDPRSSLLRKRRVILLLGEIRDSRGFSSLVEALKEDPLRAEAAQAMGYFGMQARPYLLQLLRNAENPITQAAAAKGLGRIAATTGDSSPTPLFLEMIKNPTVDIRVKTELVWTLGKSPDFRAFSVLTELEQRIWSIPSNDPELNKLRRAVDWSIREVKQGGHGDNY